jgi:hypothetical protein
MAAIRFTALPCWSVEAALVYAVTKGWAAKAAHPLMLAAVAAGLVVFAPGTSVAQQAFEPREEAIEEFPDAPGREDTFYFCTACHNFKLVAQQGMSRHRWDSTLNMMSERHGMPDVQGKDREVMLDYLEKAFPESSAPGGWQNPFLKR